MSRAPGDRGGENGALSKIDSAHSVLRRECNLPIRCSAKLVLISADESKSLLLYFRPLVAYVLVKEFPVSMQRVSDIAANHNPVCSELLRRYLARSSRVGNWEVPTVFSARVYQGVR